jgi:hypothetical protein
VALAWDDPAHPVATIRNAGDARGAAAITLEEARAELAHYHTVGRCDAGWHRLPRGRHRRRPGCVGRGPGRCWPIRQPAEPQRPAPVEFTFDVRATCRALIERVTVTVAPKGRVAPVADRATLTWRA